MVSKTEKGGLDQRFGRRDDALFPWNKYHQGQRGEKVKPSADDKIRTRSQRIFSLIKGNRLKLGGAMLCSLVVSGSTAAIAWLMKPVIDDIFVRQDLTMLKILPFVVVVLFVARSIGLYGQEFLMSYAGQSVIMQLRCALYDRIQDLPLSFFSAERTGVLMSRVTNDVNLVKALVSDAVKAAVRDCFSVVGLSCVIFYRDWRLALIAMVVLPAAFFPVVALGRRVRRISTRNQETMADLSCFLHETFSGNKIVKAFGMETYEKLRFSEKARNLFSLEIKTVSAKALSPAIMELLAGLGVAFIVWYGGSRVIDGSSTPGTLISFLAAVLLLYDPVKKISRVNSVIQEGLAATDRIFTILERESDIPEIASPVAIAPGSHRVAFEGVSFKYDAVNVLDDINLDVKPGEVLALVGMSGGGKTTLVNLIPRFYDVSAGAVRIDGVDIRQASLKSLREQVAVVSQEPILFNDTVRNNIAYGNPGAAIERIEAAARAAYADEFIRQFPKGFDTTIGELGGRLSGGEKQRICIARALLKDAPILILDEATSSLDTESEMWVQKALENLMQGRTTFVIAHRLSTISNAHRIIVLVNGRVVEQGTHEQLLALEGEYRKLYGMQFSNGASRSVA
jgi:ATP-binding cassette, subfamily B, bacterial MsbA